MRELERYIVLQVVDTRWREHLENMDYMREGIHLRGMAQKDPLVEYRNEGHVMFLELNRVIREEVIALLFHAQVEAGPEPASRAARRPAVGAAARHRTAANGNLSYEHQTARRRRRDRRGRRRRRRPRRSRGGGGAVATRPVVKSDAGERRPQRPVLVRLGQEVQALPRRLTGPRISHPRRALPARIAAAIRSVHVAPGPASELDTRRGR